jgi:hypothetical protein
MRTRWPGESDLVFMAFDLLHQDGVDLRPLRFAERKRDLGRLCRTGRVPFMRQVQTFPGLMPSSRGQLYPPLTTIQSPPGVVMTDWRGDSGWTTCRNSR